MRTLISIKEYKMKYVIKIQEVKTARYAVEAESLKEAKEQAHWRLITQTNPSVEPEYSYKVLHEDNSCQ